MTAGDLLAPRPGPARLRPIRLADTGSVAAAHPHVPVAMIEHVMAALHRLVAALESGSATSPLTGWFADLRTGWEPGITDLADHLPIPAIGRALASDNPHQALRTVLIAAQMIATGDPADGVFVVVGHPGDARAWLAARRLPDSSAVIVRDAADLPALRGMTGARTTIIVLDGGLADSYAVGQRLAALVAGGAGRFGRAWVPDGMMALRAVDGGAPDTITAKDADVDHRVLDSPADAITFLVRGIVVGMVFSGAVIAAGLWWSGQLRTRFERWVIAPVMLAAAPGWAISAMVKPSMLPTFVVGGLFYLALFIPYIIASGRRARAQRSTGRDGS